MNGGVLITGAFGYLGGRLTRFLSESTDLSLRLGTRTMRAAPGWAKGGSVVETDFSSPDSLHKACRGAATIVHLAALNEIESAGDPEKALIVNTLGTLRLVREALRASVGRFIYVSTAHVYGAPLAGRITELTPTRPVHPYAITHRAAEDFVLALNGAASGTMGIALRLSNGFGAPVDEGVNRWTLIVNDLCKQAVETGRLKLRSTGLQHRDFITLSDASRAIQHFITLPDSLCADGLFNLGGGSSMNVLEMAGRVSMRCAQVLGFAPQVETGEPSGEVMREPLDYRIDKLKKTGFALEGRIDSEIDATLCLCRSAFGKGIRR